MKVVVIVVMVVMVTTTSALPSRNLTVPEINPGCEGECEEPWVVVTAAVRPNDTLHHIWSTKGALTFLVVAGTGGPHVTIDWDALRNSTYGAITFQQDPTHVFGFVIPSLILYNDVNDKGALSGQNESYRVPVSDFTWSAEVLPSPHHQVAVSLQTTHYLDTPLPNDTRILMRVSAYGQDGRSTVLPHLIYTPDSAQIDLILDNLNLNLTQETMGWKRARWGMDVVVVTSEKEPQEGEKGDLGIKFLTQKSLDDEHTPGVFNLDQITTAGARAGDTGGGGYLQWRPVSYLNSERDISLATTVNLNTSLARLTNLTHPLMESLVYVILGENETLSGAVSSVISIGEYKDGFYRSQNYTTWTVAIGEGEAPRETFSTLIVIVISLGVVLPGLMFLVGCVVLTVRKYRNHNNSGSLLITEE